ncbi:MAG: pyridoxamine 5'-phosphate oxidase family protein [Patescibacteria group bacterium]
MKSEIFDYLNSQRVGVLAVEMPDGSPHGATVHFAYTEEPFVFFFETNRDYRKTEALFAKTTVRASFVVGTDELAKKTMQLDGIATLLRAEEKEIYDHVYLAKYPEKIKKSLDPKAVFFKFTPTWWRYTDWAHISASGTPIIVTS